MLAFLVCFDISDDRMRYRVGKELAHYGLRVQRSVFEITLRSGEELTALQKTLRPWVEDDDDLRFYPLCRACRQKAISVDGARVAAFPAAVLV